MAELLWVLLLFPSNIGALKKRETVREVWAWSNEALPESQPMLADDVLDGIGTALPSEAVAALDAISDFPRSRPSLEQ